jgi:hypothetical protein
LGTDFFAAAFLTGALFCSTFFTAVFLTAALFAVAAGFSFCFAAWNAAHLFLVASEIALRPAALSFLFGLDVSGVAGGEDGSEDSA